MPDDLPTAASELPPAEPSVEVEAEEQKTAEPEPPAAPAAPPENKKRWYVVRVQAGREDSIKEAIERRVRIEGLEEFYGRTHIPVERYTERRKNNKTVTKERKKFPGYLFCEVEYNDRVLYLFRETSGVGDFVGGTGSADRPPMPMSDREVQRMMHEMGEEVPTPDTPPVSPFEPGDRVKVRDGTFVGMEGEIKEKMEALGKVKVELTIFGRPVMVDLEYWQVEPA